MCVNVDTLSALHTVCVRLLHFPSVCHNQPSVPCLPPPPPPLHPSISPLFSSQTQSFNYLSFPLFSSFFYLSLSLSRPPSFPLTLHFVLHHSLPLSFLLAIPYVSLSLSVCIYLKPHFSTCSSVFAFFSPSTAAFICFVYVLFMKINELKVLKIDCK